MYSLFHMLVVLALIGGVGLLAYGRWKGKFLHKNWSTYGGFVIFCAAAFGVQPTVAALVSVFIFLPTAIAITIWLAKHEVTKAS